ncbi:acyltransferase [uncultured Phascolarctobacterium sp.]|uniref:acyltransferase n=1 Tax=uncultured Phascolarctobacterium sp. TaxID=512296 RepID=UPI0025EAFEE6|nr:acyltransferase [uncultured Phascolarctobacterium sp.]
MRNTIIDNMRGLCMLGVIGIHIGSLALAPNSFTLYLLLEILSRYSVPSFFFISGYGLACTDKGLLAGSALNYIDFMKKRLRGAGLPYVSWSLFYMLYFWLILPPGFVSWEPLHVAFVLFFGLGCYHLYFMVILLWFYGTYPLWRKLLRIIIHHNHAFMLVLLFIFQLLFNWWTTHPGVNSSTWSVLAKNFFDYRLNYLPLHYLLIFIGGGLAAVYWEKFLALLHKYAIGVIVLYLASIGWDVYSCYDAVKSKGYSLLDLANTYHQLSPQGLVYTIGSILFFCLALDWLERKANNATDIAPLCDTANMAPLEGSCRRKATEGCALAALLYKAISVLSAYSMLIYFVHPLLLDWITSAANYFGIIMTVKKVTLAYVLLVCSSLALSLLLTRLFAKCSTAKLLFTGKR